MLKPPKGRDMLELGRRRKSILSPPVLAPWPASHRSSLDTRHYINQSLAKHNRKPSQIIENNHQRPKSIASFCRILCVASEPRLGPPPLRGFRGKALRIKTQTLRIPVQIQRQLPLCWRGRETRFCGRARGGRRRKMSGEREADVRERRRGAGDSRAPDRDRRCA
jgi:hypothetical protein